MKTIFKIMAAALMLMPLHARMHECSAQTAGDPTEIDSAADILGGTNYVATYTAVKPGVSHTVDVEYYDGLGYPSQRISSRATSEGGTLVTPIVYDNMRRADATAYLPYLSESGSYALRTGAVSQQASYYASHYPGEGSPFSNTVYETGPEGRPLSFMQPGGMFRTAGRKTEMEYGVNDGTEGVRRIIDYEAESTAAVDGYYPAGTLRKVSTTDEDGHETTVFSDAFGRKILSRSTLGNGYADTYYVYDFRDNLKFVIQPEGVPHIDESVAASSDELSLDVSFIELYCFTWKYDGWGNVVESHVPGGGHCYYTYDGRDRVVMYRDSEMVAKGVAVKREYDNMDRIVKETYGEYYGSNSEFFPIIDSRRCAYYSAGSTGIPFGNRLAFVPDEVAMLADFRTDRCLTLLSYEYVYTALKPQDVVDINDGEDYAERAYYYDGKGRLIQTVEKTSSGWTNITSMKHDFVGNVLSRLEKHTTPGGSTKSLRTDYTYDARGRVLSCERSYGGANLDTVNYAYDDLGRLVSKSVGNKIVEENNYDIRGWTRGITASRDTSVLFSEAIRFENPQMPGTTSLYSGNISEIETVQRGNPKDIYAYSYDEFSRLTDARHFIGGPAGASNTDTERFMEYDLNGNLTSLQRYGGSPSDCSTLLFGYTGNRLTGAAEIRSRNITNSSYAYDMNGNRTSDSRTGLEFTYNLLNLPCEVRDSQDNMKMRYTYLSDGTKFSALDAAGDGLLYRGNFVYEKDGQNISLESIAWDEGRIRNKLFQALLHDDEPIDATDTLAVLDSLPGLPWHPKEPFFPGLLAEEGHWVEADTTELVLGPAIDREPLYQDQWFVRDHLGNVRSVIDLTRSAAMPADSVILEQNDYLPYGTKSSTSSLSTDSAFRYRYAGKEEQRFGAFDSQLLDFGARCYDPWSCQWTAVDPMAEKYSAMTPYGYCVENPVNYLDPEGSYVAIRFKENGHTYEFKYSGSQTNIPNNDFVQSFVEAYTYNKENWSKAGFSGDSPTTELVEREDIKVTIKHSNGNGNEYLQENGGIPVIYWDPYQGAEGEGGVIMSPASVLAHEADHAVDDLTDAKAHSVRRDKKDSKYDNKEERRVITGSEQKTALANGEIKPGQVTRYSHKATTVYTLGVTSNEKDPVATNYYHSLKSHRK